MSDKEIVCTSCEAEFKVLHDEVDDPRFCPFCGEKVRINYDDDDDWYDDGDDERDDDR